ncbi:hypothetical protein RJF_3764 [Candidozyma auris]
MLFNELNASSTVLFHDFASALIAVKLYIAWTTIPMCPTLPERRRFDHILMLPINQ